MEEEQEREWLEAQKIVISEDLVTAAKQQLLFLAAVDRRRWLYDGPLLDYAIFRYKAFWLPLLSKYTEDGAAREGHVYVPLDCEWIWHCHRLNPAQYYNDCQRVFGRTLNNQNIISSLHGKCKHEMAKSWNELYPNEPFELDPHNLSCKKIPDINLGVNASITYDLVSVVKRQSSFFYQVSRPWMHDNRILEEATARYKGFLHLIKTNQDKSVKQFCVPTYDIDIIWHTHQLHPVSYCNDMFLLLGRILEHDDTDSDRSKGKKLYNGFTQTSNQFEETYGLRYWRAGTMYRGTLPSPLTVIPGISGSETTTEHINHKHLDFALPQMMVVEVLLEVIGIKNFPDAENKSLYVSFSKKLPDAFFSGGYNLSILSLSGQKQVTGFKCEPTGELILSLISKTNFGIGRAKPIGTTTISLEELTNPDSKLYVQKWFELKTNFETLGSQPVSIHVAASFSVPVPAPFILRLVKGNPILSNPCFFRLPGTTHLVSGWTHILNQNGEVIGLKMRDIKRAEEKCKLNSELEVVAITKESRKVNLVAQYLESSWTLVGSNLLFVAEDKRSQEGHTFNNQGGYQIKLFQGKKLEYESKTIMEQNGNHFVTFVEFSAEHPYGKAVALLDMKDGLIEVNVDWFVLPAIAMAFILKKLLKKDGYGAIVGTLIPNINNVQETSGSNGELDTEINSSVIVKAASNGADGSVTKMGSRSCGSDCRVQSRALAQGEEGEIASNGSCGDCSAGICGRGMMKSKSSAAVC